MSEVTGVTRPNRRPSSAIAASFRSGNTASSSTIRPAHARATTRPGGTGPEGSDTGTRKVSLPPESVDERHFAAAQELRVDRGATGARSEPVLDVGQRARRGVCAQQRLGRTGQQRSCRGRLGDRKVRHDSAGRRCDEPLEPAVANGVGRDHVHRESAQPGKAGAERVEPVGEQQPRRVGGVGCCTAPEIESRQVGAAIVRQLIEEREELRRLAGARDERPRGLGAITEDDKVDGRVLPGRRRQQSHEQRAVLPDGSRAATARGVPGDGHAIHLACRRRRPERRRVADCDVPFSAELLDRGEQRRQLGEANVEIVAGRGTRERRLGDPAVVPFGERQVAEAAQLRLHRPLHDFDAQGQSRDDDPRQRHVARRVAAGHDEGCHGHDPNRPLAARRQWEDPRPKHVAADVLDQPGVDPPAHLGFEHHSGLLLRDAHAVDHPSADIEGVTGHGRAVRQRELEVAGELPRVRVGEGDGRDGFRLESRNGDADVHSGDARRRLVRRQLEDGRRRQYRRASELGGGGPSRQRESDGYEQAGDERDG